LPRLPRTLRAPHRSSVSLRTLLRMPRLLYRRASTSTAVWRAYLLARGCHRAYVSSMSRQRSRRAAVLPRVGIAFCRLCAARRAQHRARR